MEYITKLIHDNLLEVELSQKHLYPISKVQDILNMRFAFLHYHTCDLYVTKLFKYQQVPKIVILKIDEKSNTSFLNFAIISHK